MAKVKKPPTLLTAAILSTPLAAKNVTTTKNTLLKFLKVVLMSNLKSASFE